MNCTIKRFYLSLFLICFSAVLHSSSPGDPDTTFDSDGYLVDANAFEISDVVTQSDGKIVVVGVDATENSVYVARYTSVGALDTSFNTTGYHVDTNGGAAHGIALQSDGKIVVAGVDSAGNSVYVARYLANGLLDTTGNGGSGFNQSGTPGYIVDTNGSEAYDLAIQSDGKIVVVGIDSAGDYVYLARYTTAGVLDTTFSTDGYHVDTAGSAAYGIAIQTDGKIVVAGADAAYDYMYVARYLSDGLLDTTGNGGSGFNQSGTPGYIIDTTGGAASGVAMQFDGKIVVTGVDPAGNYVYLARYTAAGVLDTTFSTDGYLVDTNGAVAYGLTIQSDGSIVIVGQDPTFNSVYLARYLSDGSLDTNANGGAGFNQAGTPGYLIDSHDGAGYGLVMQTDGQILVVGQDTSFGCGYVARYHGYEPGTINVAYNKGGTDAGFINLTTELGAGTNVPTTNPSKAKKILQLSDGSYLVATDDGTNTYVNKFSVEDVVATAGFGTNGLLTIAGKINVSDIFFDQTGALILIGGSGAAASDAGWVVRYSAAGVVDATFAVTDVLDTHTSVGQQSNGRIIVAGMEDNKGVLIAYNSVTGAVDTSFGANGRRETGAYTSNTVTVNSMVVKSDDTIFGIENDSTNEYSLLFAVDENGTFVTSTGDLTGGSYACDSTSNQLVLDADGNLVVISARSGSPYSIFMSRYSYNGSFSIVGSLLTLLAGTTGLTQPTVYSMGLDLNGKLIVTGYDTTGSTPFIMRVEADLSGLDTTFNTTGVTEYNTITNASGTAVQWYDATITAEGLIIVAGYATVSATNKPYIANFYGDDFIDQYEVSVTAGTPGTIDTNFGTSGSVGLGSVASGIVANVLLPTTIGGYYIGFNDGTLARLTNANVVDTDYGGGEGIAANSPAGVFSIILDGSSRVLLAGTTGGAGWVARYTAGDAGTLDSTFNSGAAVTIPSSTVGTMAVEQTLARVVVAGIKSGGNGALFGFTDAGVVDTTFATAGIFDTGVASGVYALACDQYDRLIIAYLNGTNVDVSRLTSDGQLDATFGTAGVVASAIANADQAAQIRLDLDNAGNIVVAAMYNTSDTLSVRSLDNLSASSGNGASIYTQLDITALTNTPVLTDLIATADGKVLLSGHQSSNNDMWVVRVTAAGAADTAFGGGDGIMTFTFDVAGTVTARALQAIAMYGSGEISMVGAETNSADSPTVTPFLARAYNEPYTTQILEAPNSKVIGTSDLTFGLAGANEVTFFALPGTDANDVQVARAIAFQDDHSYVVALDGYSAGGSDSRVFLNMFDVDGTLDLNFDTDGQAEIANTYEQEYVNDMITFTTPGGVNKAILAGYATNTTLSATNSLLMQYNLSTPGLDSSFGGFDRDASGVAFGDGQKAQVVGRQSSGRIIAGGLDQSGNGLLLGYTSAGKLDASFATDGYITQGSNGIYSQVIDTQDRIVIAYNDGSNNVAVARILADGSGLDQTFGTSGVVAVGDMIAGISGNTNLRVAIDASGNIFVAAVVGAGCTIKKYPTAGTSVTATLTITAANLGTITALVLARLLIDENGKAIVIGSSTLAGADSIMEIRALADLSALDSTFNPNGTPGYLAYNNGTDESIQDAAIHPDGRIIVVGSQG